MNKIAVGENSKMFLARLSYSGLLIKAVRSPPS